MRLRQVLDELLEVLEAEENGDHFKSLGSLRKSKFQHDKSEDDAFIRHDMYAGTIGNAEAAKKGAETRSKWYKNPENKKKFKEAIKKREERNKKKKEQQ